MAKRVHDLTAHICTEYGGGERVWTYGKNGDQLRANLEGLPG